MSPVHDFPHETTCECGRHSTIAGYQRGLVVACEGCDRPLGPFEPAGASATAREPVIERERAALGREAGDALLLRLQFMAERDTRPSPHELLLTQALVGEFTSRLSRHGLRPPDGDPDAIPADEYALVTAALQLMDRVNYTPSSGEEVEAHRGLCDAIGRFTSADVVPLTETGSKAALSNSVLLHPTLLKVRWLRRVAGRVYGDPAFTSRAFRSLADNPNLPEDVRLAAGEWTDAIPPANAATPSHSHRRVRNQSDTDATRRPPASGRQPYVWIFTALLYGIPIGGISGCVTTPAEVAPPVAPEQSLELQLFDLSQVVMSVLITSVMMGFFVFIVIQWLTGGMSLPLNDAARVEANARLKTNLLNALLSLPGNLVSIVLIYGTRPLMSALTGPPDRTTSAVWGAAAGALGFLLWFGGLNWWASKRKRRSTE